MLDIVFFNVNNANAIIVVKANKAISNLSETKISKTTYSHHSQSSLLNGSLDVSVDQDLGLAIGLLAAGSDLIVSLLVLQNLMGPGD